MAEPDDLLNKADALMARHRPARTGDASYLGIPVLDEVVVPPAESDDLPVLTELIEPEPAQAGMVEIKPAHTESVAPELPPEEESEALAAKMRASLLAALQPQIDSLIEESLKESLAPLIERLFDDLRGDLQRIARNTLSEAINTAVQQEFDRRK